MKRFALLGHNIGYSLSPQLHTAGSWRYGNGGEEQGV